MKKSTPKALPSFETLNKNLEYNPETGVIIRKCKPSVRHKAGGVAGSLHKGYIIIAVERGKYFAHRIAWKMFYGEDPISQIDHIYGDKSNNKISNLRVATNSENHMNVDVKSNSATGVKGVCFNKQRGKYKATVMVGGKRHHAGFFCTVIEAREARNKLAKKLHGEFYRAAM